jgi:hypothetical protein
MGAALKERIWFYYARETQLGPMTESELREAIVSGSLNPTDFVYREGFADWRRLSEVSELNSDTTPLLVAIPKQQESQIKRRAPRSTIHELVVAHNGCNVATGHIKNISIYGVYFETEDAVFQVNDEVKLTLKEGQGLGKPMHLKAIVVRQVREQGLHVGYGLELRTLDESSRSRIIDYVKRHQSN